MSNYFGENIKTQRKKRDLTQEQLAEMLGVTSQAISKWERGSALPDISLLPIIANFFCVSVDNLLGVDISRRESAIDDIIAEADKLCTERRYADAVSYLREALVQYPAEPRIMYKLAWNLTGTIREHWENLYEAIEIYEKILEICDNPRLRALVTRDLMYRYYTADEPKKALRMTELMPSFDVCREYNLGRSNLLEGRELAEYLMANIRLYGLAMEECLEYFLDNVIISEEDMRPYSVEIGKHKLDLLKQILE